MNDYGLKFIFIAIIVIDPEPGQNEIDVEIENKKDNPGNNHSIIWLKLSPMLHVGLSCFSTIFTKGDKFVTG